MRKLSTNILTFLFAGLLCFGSCDIVELILYEKQVNVVLHGIHTETYEITGTEFERLRSITVNEIFSGLDIPDNAVIENINLNRIDVEIIPNENNAASTIGFTGYVLGKPGRNKIYWKQDGILFISKADSGNGISPLAGRLPTGIEEIKSQLKEMVITGSITEMDLGLISTDPGQDYLDVEFKIILDYDIEIKYCGMVPGTTDLPDCE